LFLPGKAILPGERVEQAEQCEAARFIPIFGAGNAAFRPA
jgi:hypothetical protein